MSTKTRSARKRTRDDRLDLVFKALSDRTRRALLAQLERGPLKITDLAAPFDMSLPSVSKHLRVLERAGLVRRNVRGRVHLCTLEPKALRPVEAWLAHYREFWDGNLERLARHVGEG